MTNTTMKTSLSKEQIDMMLRCTIEAGERVLELKKNNLEITKKSDNSYVTNIDKELDIFLTDVIINKVKSNAIIISEEDVSCMDSNSCPLIKNGAKHWSIDPIDSTHSLINDNPYYCINVAFIENDLPTFGIIYAPETKTMWYGALGYGSFKQVGNNKAEQIFAREIPHSGAVLMSSEEQITPKEFLKEHNIVKEIKLPSAIKFTFLAEGLADYYTRRRNKACDWDIASAHAIIIASGGSMRFLEDFKYGVPPYSAPALIAMGKRG